MVGHVYVHNSNVSYTEMLRVFSSVRTIRGCVSIRNTNFPDLSFFESLETITCTPNEIQAYPISNSFSIVNNQQLKQLNLLKLTAIFGPANTRNLVRENHPELCLTEKEYIIINDSETPVRLCNDDPACYSQPGFDNGEQIPIGCKVITWNIILNEPIKLKYLKRLQTLLILKGYLYIHSNQTIESLDLSNLILVYNPQPSEYSTGNKCLLAESLNFNVTEILAVRLNEKIHFTWNDNIHPAPICIENYNTTFNIPIEIQLEPKCVLKLEDGNSSPIIPFTQPPLS